MGPRTHDQLLGQLEAGDVTLSAETLDRIDAIVAPGQTIDITDTMWEHGTRALDAVQRRR